MTRRVEAIYERGLLRPLEPLSLAESQRVNLTITDVPGDQSRRDAAITEGAQAEAATLKSPPAIEEVRAALASIPGLLSRDVIAERGDY